MPIYEYFCRSCDLQYEIIKEMKKAEKNEPCSKCGEDLQMVIPAVHSNRSVCQFEPHFNYAFGSKVTNTHQVKDLVKKHEDTTGQKLIEVGNEKVDSMKDNRKSFKLTEGELKQAHEILREYR